MLFQLKGKLMNAISCVVIKQQGYA